MNYKKLICRFFGHKDKTYQASFVKTCVRCKRTRHVFEEVALECIKISKDYYSQDRFIKIIK